MALTNALPQVWAAALLRAFPTVSIWAALARDFSADVSEYGKTLNINRITGTITVRAYAAGSDLEAPEQPSDENVALALDQHRYINVSVPDVERVQARADVLADWSRQAMEKIAGEYDQYVYGVFNGGWSDSGAGQTRFEYDKTPSPVTADWRQGLVDEALDMVERMDNSRWPQDRRWVVISTEAKKHLLTYLIVDKSTLGSISTEAMQNAALAQLLGCRVVVDPQLPTSAAENNPIHDLRHRRVRRSRAAAGDRGVLSAGA